LLPKRWVFPPHLEFVFYSLQGSAMLLLACEWSLPKCQNVCVNGDVFLMVGWGLPLSKSWVFLSRHVSLRDGWLAHVRLHEASQGHPSVIPWWRCWSSNPCCTCWSGGWSKERASPLKVFHPVSHHLLLQSYMHCSLTSHDLPLCR
jgi:hypothetical protein